MTPQMGVVTDVDLAAAIAAHAADLDAHNRNWMQTLITGVYIRPLPWYATDTAAVGVNRLYATPFIVARALTIDRLAIEVTTAAGAGSIARLGIYANGIDLYPGALIQDYGTVLVDAIAVVAAAGVQALASGIYWLVVVADAAPTLVHLRAAWSPLGQLSTDFTAPFVGTGWYNVGIGAGPLPDSYPAGGTLGFDRFPAVLPRLLSLD
ncbi:hypothetical protein ES708_02611 [subsurface metagenome]